MERSFNESGFKQQLMLKKEKKEKKKLVKKMNYDELIDLRTFACNLWPQISSLEKL